MEVKSKTAQINARSKDSFRFSETIEKPYGTLDSVLSWCRSEITNDWGWTLGNDISASRLTYIFYFDSERDIVAFRLKWS